MDDALELQPLDRLGGVAIAEGAGLRQRPAARQVSSSDGGLGGYLWRLALVMLGMMAVVYGYQTLLGSPDPSLSRFVPQFSGRYFLFALVFLTATACLRQREAVMAAVAVPCLIHVYLTSPPLLPYVAVLVPALYWLLGQEARPSALQSLRFWAGLVLGLVVFPKAVQAEFHLDHGSWLDVNQNLFAGLVLRYAYYYYERCKGLAPPGRFWDHVSYMLFVPQVTGMLNLPPSQMHERWTFAPAALWRGFESVAWAAVKIPVVLWLEQRVLPAWGYGRGYQALRAAPVASVWVCLFASYLYWALLVSTKFNLMVALFRFFGLNVDDNFRWPLLATSPVELWRRWNIYNRKLLLKFVYFPLGGNRRWVYRNILCTFLASALLLHTGFLGSPWPSVDPGQLRDWLLYFSAQGLVVCVAYWWLQRPFWEDLSPIWRRSLAALGWAFTLACSAWLHVLPLAAGDLLNMSGAPVDSLLQRFALMLKALGI